MISLAIVAVAMFVMWVGPGSATAAVTSWSVTPPSFDFGAVETGARSAPATFTLTNTGEAGLPAPRVELEFGRPDEREGSESEIFEDDAFDCVVRADLGPGESCAVTVIFQPVNRGPRGGTVIFLEPGHEPSDVTATFSGLGIGPVVSFSPPQLSLPSRLLGVELSPPGVLTVTNTGDADLDLSGISFQGLGSNPNGFRVVGGSCHAGAVVPAGSFCTVQVTYTPTQAASFLRAELATADNAAHGGQTVEVVGGGVAQSPIAPSERTIRIISRPRARSTDRTARFRFLIRGGGVPFACSLDGRPFRPCRSPKTYRGLAPGTHLFRVRPRIRTAGVWAGAAATRWRIVSTGS